MQKVSKWLPQTFTITFFTLVVVAGLALSAHRVLQVQQDMLKQTAIEDAANYAETLIAFRSVYTSEVVKVATQAGLPATHDYMDRPGSIPLPATLTKILGEKIGVAGSVQVGLYSEYPFPWRDDASTLDSFQVEAIRELKENPSTEVIAIEQGPDGPVIRALAPTSISPGTRHAFAPADSLRGRSEPAPHRLPQSLTRRLRSANSFLLLDTLTRRFARCSNPQALRSRGRTGTT